MSSVTPFEISTKVRLGQFPAAEWLLENWEASMSGLAASPLPVSHSHGICAGELDWHHRDPFDRLLAGQALTEGLSLVTADPVFDSAPGLELLRW